MSKKYETVFSQMLFKMGFACDALEPLPNGHFVRPEVRVLYEMFKAGIQAASEDKVSDLSDVRRVNRGFVHWQGREYFHEDLLALHENLVQVRPIESGETIVIWTLGKNAHFVCQAEAQHIMPFPDEAFLTECQQKRMKAQSERLAR